MSFNFKTKQKSKENVCDISVTLQPSQTLMEPSFSCLIRLHTENSSGCGLIANLDTGEMQSVLHFGILSSLIGPFAKD